MGIWVKLLSIACTGLGIVGLCVTFVLFRINRKKSIWGIVLFCILLGLGIYYIYLAFNTVPAVQNEPVETNVGAAPVPAAEAQSPAAGEQTPYTNLQVVLDVDGQQFTIDRDDYLEVSKDSTIKVVGVKDNGKTVTDVKVNVVGFTPPKNNNADDIGYEFSYKNMQKRFATDESKTVFRLDLSKDRTKLGSAYLKFTS